MKKKIVLLTLLIAIASLLAVLFALSISADEKTITVTYNNFSGSVWETAKPNADGSYTLRAKKKSGNGTVTLANGTKVDKEFYGWFSKDGTLYAPGETVTFTKSTQLYEAYGVTVNTAEDLDAVSGTNQVSMFVRLGADITSSVSVDATWATTVVDLNGHNLTVTDNDNAFYGYRGASVIIGKGKVTHAPQTLNTKNDAGFFYHTLHFFEYEKNPQLCWVGKDVEIETPYSLVYVSTDENYANVPNIEVYGKVNAKSIVRGSIFNNANCNIYEGAEITLTGDKAFDFKKLSGTNVYMKLSLDGEIILTNPNAELISDFVLSPSFEVKPITSGKYTIPSANADKLARLVASTHKLQKTENENGTVTCEIISNDCVHNWIVNEKKTVKATLDNLGIDAIICSNCQLEIETIVAYAPSDVEISVTVNENGEEKTYTMLAGDVFDFSVTSKNGSRIVSEIKDVIYHKNDIVKLEIPYGVELINIFSMASLKELTFMDNSIVDFKKNIVSDCPALEKIAIGKRNVVFSAGSGENAEAGFFVNCPNLATLDVSKANATFHKQSFAANKTIKHLILGEGNTYIFNEDCFRHSSLTEVIIPDNTPTTLAKKCFAETETIKYVYVGANSISSKRFADETSLFGGNSYLSKVVLMDIEYIGRWVLSTKKVGNKYQPLCDIYVYSHSESLTVHSEGFNDRTGNYTVYLYTTNTSLTAPTTCNYVVFKGLGHAYSESVIYESTCVTPGKGAYITDCPCNIDYRECSYTTASNTINDYKNKSFDALGTDEYDLPLKTEHTNSDIVNNVVFVDGYMSLGTKSFKCLYCDVTVGVEENASFPALFAFLGYSTPVDGKLKLTVGYDVNVEAIGEYKDITGIDLDYGVVAASYDKLDGKAPFDEGLENVPVIKVAVNKSYASFEFVMTGFSEAQLDLALVMCAYVYDGTKYVYLQEAQNDIPTSVTIGNYL